MEGEKIKKQLGIWKSELVESNKASGGIGILWDPRRIDIFPLTSTKNLMGSTVKSYKNNLLFIIIHVYGPIPTATKKEIWNEISIFMDSKPLENFLIGEDFNAILNPSRKSRWVVNYKSGNVRF